MARDDDSTTRQASWEEEAFRWQRPQRPEDPGRVRDVAVDPFSLRHFSFSRVDIDRPLPIPSVSVDYRRRVSPSPARFHPATVPPAGSASSSPSPRASNAGGLKAPAAPTRWDGAGAHTIAPSGALPRSNLWSAGGDETELADAGLDAAPSLTERNKASEPQRWGSNVPLIAAAADAEEYSFGGYAVKDGRGKQAAKHAGKAPPFTCYSMFVPGLTRRIKPPTSSTATAAARSSPSSKFGETATVQLQPIDPGSTRSASARPSTMLLAAVSLEHFDCGGLSTTSSSPRFLGLDDDDDGDGEAASAAASDFDLPLELILGCDAAGGDADLPVCAAFLFDSDGVRKSVLKRRLEAGAGWETRRPSLGKVPMDASSWISNPQVRVSLKSRSP